MREKEVERISDIERMRERENERYKRYRRRWTTGKDVIKK